MKNFITNDSKETQKLGEMLAQEVKGGQIICLTGDLGAGKTTFVQGFLKGLKVKGPYTSPTFLIMKHYEVKSLKLKVQSKYKIPNTKYQIQNIYHVDAYRVEAKDILALGWEEMIKHNPSVSGNIIIIEWADRIKKIIPNLPAGGTLWIKFKWLDDQKRQITFV